MSPNKVKHSDSLSITQNGDQCNIIQSSVSIVSSSLPNNYVSLLPGLSPASTHVHLSLLPDKEVFRYKNIYASQVLIPEALRKFLEWGSEDKLADETYLVYLLRTKGLSVTQLRKKYGLSKNGIDLMNNKCISEDFDVTLLYSLIQCACKNLAERSDPIWESEDESRVEVLLRKAKDYRNNVCHGVASGAVCPHAFDEIIDLTRKLIDISGRMYKKETHVVRDEVERITNMINGKNLTEKEVKLIEVECKFKKGGFEESKAHWKRFCCKETLLFSSEQISREKVFHPLEICLNIAPTDLATVNKISYRDILDPWYEDDAAVVTVIRGEAGTGKSTLMKTIVQQFFGLMNPEIKNLDRFNMVYYFQCRERSIKSFKEFLKKNFPETCRKLDLNDIMDCFSKLSNLIFIDGYDEVNDHSIAIVQEIMQKIQNGLTCKVFITCRPYISPELEKMLKCAGLAYRCCDMADISDPRKQEEFLLRYGRFNSGKSPPEGMIESFRNLSAPVKKYFIFPINLVMFYHLYSISPDKVKFWCSDADVTVQIVRLYTLMISNMFRDKGIPNRDMLVEDIVTVISDYALEFYDARKITLLEEDFNELCRLVFCVLERYGAANLVDSKHILSIMLLRRNSPANCSGDFFQFAHKTVQELFGCMALMPLFREHKLLSFKDILEMKYGEKIRDFRMYEKMYVFCLVHLVENKDCIDSARVRELVGLMPIPRDGSAGSVFHYISRIVHCVANDEVVAVATIPYLKDFLWKTEHKYRLSNAAVLWRFLPKSQHPQRVEIILNDSVQPECLLQLLSSQVLSGYEGELLLDLGKSLQDMEPCDDAISLLKNSKMKLKKFRGCLRSLEAQSVLSSVVSSDCVLDIGLLRPLEHGLVNIEANICSGDENGNGKTIIQSSPKLGTSSVSIEGTYDKKVPLPCRGSTPPELVLINIPKSAVQYTVDTILRLAPLHNQYYGILLQNCRLTDSELQSVVQTLKRQGIATSGPDLSNGFQSTRWSVVKGSWHDSELRDLELYLSATDREDGRGVTAVTHL